MDQEQFNSIVAQLRGLNSSGILNTSDLSILQNAILGVLTDTYTPAYIGKTPEQLMADYAPNFFNADQTNDPILKDVASDISKGYDLWTIKQNLKAVLQNDPNITSGSAEVDDYLNQAELYYREWNAYQKAQREDNQSKIENDPFRKSGLPGFDERYQAVDVYRGAFEKLAKDYAAQPYESKEKKYPPGQKPSSIKDLVATSTAKKQTTQPTVEDRVGFDALANTLFGWTKNIQNKAYKTPQADKAAVQPTADASTNKKYAPGEKLRTGTFDVEKAKLAGNSPERMARVAQAMVDLLQSRVDASGATPLKDALAQRGIFSAAAAIPKSSGASKNYTVKGSNVVELGN